jgi:catechol 2,3-dioxygenase-like lactoylglutathione lyase family enzyme
MSTPKIRHLALFAREPEKLAKFYEDAFQMKRVHDKNNAFFLTDGYITMAILPATANGSTLPGLNHFGFKVENRDETLDQVVTAGAGPPLKRPDDRPYAEYRGYDLEGNMFDVSQHGFEEVETEEDRKRKTGVPVGAGSNGR